MRGRPPGGLSPSGRAGGYVMLTVTPDELATRARALCSQLWSRTSEDGVTDGAAELHSAADGW